MNRGIVYLSRLKTDFRQAERLPRPPDAPGKEDSFSKLLTEVTQEEERHLFFFVNLCALEPRWQRVALFFHHEATWIINDYTKDGPCDVFTLDRSGTGPGVRPTYDMPVIVGWTNSIRRGADPFPCNRRWHHDYQGLIKFDFQEDAAIRSLLESRRVVNADLVLHQHGIPGRSNLLGRTPVRSYRLTRLSSSWPAETRIAMSNLEPDIDLPPFPWPLEGNLRFDAVADGPEIRAFLTYTVQGWIDGSIPNHGLSITISPMDLNEAGWTDTEEFLHAYYAELELTLVPR